MISPRFARVLADHQIKGYTLELAHILPRKLAEVAGERRGIEGGVRCICTKRGKRSNQLRKP